MSHRCYKEVVFLISCRKKGSLKLKVHVESLGSDSFPKIKKKTKLLGVGMGTLKTIIRA